ETLHGSSRHCKVLFRNGTCPAFPLVRGQDKKQCAAKTQSADQDHSRDTSRKHSMPTEPTARFHAFRLAPCLNRLIGHEALDFLRQLCGRSITICGALCERLETDGFQWPWRRGNFPSWRHGRVLHDAPQYFTGV